MLASFKHYLAIFIQFKIQARLAGVWFGLVQVWGSWA